MAVVSSHALYAYATLAAAQLALLDSAQAIATVRCRAPRLVACVDREGFAVMVPVLAPSEYLALADEMSASTVRTLLDAGDLGDHECNDYDHMYSSPRQGRAYEELRQE